DYYTSVPGLNLTTGGAADTVISIRGLTTSGTTVVNPTVGIIVDDAPFGPTNAIGHASGVPEIDPGDLARIEVLRGPQGTLYGASSMGGLVKFVTIDPSTERLSGRIQTELNYVQNSGEMSYGVHGAVNVPLTDTLAVRASGFVRGNPGYIDNPILHL